jgi:hypothetical protein
MTCFYTVLRDLIGYVCIIVDDLFLYCLTPDFLYHLTNVFTNYSMNIDKLVFKLLEVTLVLVRKSLKFLLLRNQVPIVRQSMNNRNCV